MPQNVFGRLAVALPLVLLLAAACGDDDEDGGEGGGEAAEARTVALRLTGSEKAPQFSAPKSVEAGLVRLELTNAAKGDHGAQLLRVDGNRTRQEIAKAGEAWGDKGQPLPPWFHLVGGVGTTKAGQTSSVTQELTPGNYVVFDIDSDAGTTFKVTGDGGGELPATEQRVDAGEYFFKASGLKAGRSRVEFANVGKEPHFMVAAPILPGKTLADVRKAVSQEEQSGPPPIDEKNAVSTAVLDGGLKQVTEIQLKPGKYALLCFVPDRKGGPPHVAKGMVSEANVR